MPQILDFLSSDLGVTLHRTRSTGSPRGGDCGGPVPSTAACGEGGEDPEAPPCSLPLPPPPLRWGRGGDKGGPSAPAETLGQPPAGEGPPEQEASVLLGASSGGAQGAHGPGSSPGSATSRLGHQGPRVISLSVPQSPRLQMGRVGWMWTHRPQH